jgi:hypothetical protein
MLTTRGDCVEFYLVELPIMVRIHAVKTFLFSRKLTPLDRAVVIPIVLPQKLLGAAIRSDAILFRTLRGPGNEKREERAGEQDFLHAE